jgi:hypothetical protein
MDYHPVTKQSVNEPQEQIRELIPQLVKLTKNSGEAI